MTDHRTLLEAASFAARAHRHQVRKDGQTPYAAHAFRVCLIIRHVFGIDDTDLLMAALLHDTIEDTPTDYDDIEERFGPKVAKWVAALTKDMRLADDEREAAYVEVLARAEPAVKIAKLGDLYDNLTDSKHLTIKSRQRTIERSHRYLNALEQNLPEIAKRPMELVQLLLKELDDRDSSSD